MWNEAIFNRVNQLVGEEKYKRALALLEMNPEPEDPRYATLMGHCYSSLFNDEKAIEWYKIAANKNFPDAQYCLGILYLDGEDKEEKYDEAVELIKKAAEQDYLKAMEMLGMLLSMGEKSDMNESISWLEKAGANGSALAEALLPSIYAFQFDYLDYKKAVYWGDLAIEHGDYSPCSILAYCYLNGGHGIEIDLDKYKSYLLEGAAHDDEDCLIKVADNHYSGERDFEYDREKALEIYRRLAKKGYKPAIDRLYDLGYRDNY